MTKIKVFRNNEGNIVALEVKGHTGYAVEGSDIVCAAVSALTQNALLGIKQVAKIETEDSISEGYLKFTLSKTNVESNAILETLYLGLKDLTKGYAHYIKMEDCKYVY